VTTSLPCYTTQIQPAVQSCNSDAARTIVQAFIAGFLDWCNLLLYSVPENLSVQNAAAHLLTSTGCHDHITLMLSQLHWLPIQRRVEFKIACFVHQSLALKALTYLTADIRLISEHGRLSFHFQQDTCCSTETEALLLRDHAHGTFLPANLGQMTSYGQYRRHLKSHLFRIF